MPKLICPCGFVHDLSPIPDDGWVTIRSKDYEAVIDSEITRHEISGGHAVPANDDSRVGEYDRATRTFVEKSGLLYECPNCGRIMWKKSKGAAYCVFSKDSEG
jgi:hypothetical protein